MRAAIRAQELGADVAMISKVHPVRSHSNAAQGGINGPGLGEGGGPWEEHAFETTKASDYLGDQDAIDDVDDADDKLKSTVSSPDLD